MVKLYDHQAELIAQLKEAHLKHKRVCLQLPTGGGKTVVASHLIQKLLGAGKKVLFLVHLKELIEQTAKTLVKENIFFGIINPDYPFKPSQQLYLASVQTLIRRKEKINFVPDWIIFDEFHHAVSNSNQELLSYYHKLNPSLRLTGLTATPRRLDGKGLAAVADAIVCGKQTSWLMENNFLSKYRMFLPPNDIDFSKVHILGGEYKLDEVDSAVQGSNVFGSAVSHYLDYVNGEQALVFCTSITASMKIQAMFADAGVVAAHLDGGMSKHERSHVVERFSMGEIKVLTNCSLISEGFDVPACNAVFLLRPTQSLSLYLQQIGRGLRRSPDGKECYIFDHVGNVDRHGFPDDDREWTLADSPKKASNQEKKKQALVTCFDCGYQWRANPKIRACPACGHAKTPPKVEVILDVKLKEVKRSEADIAKGLFSTKHNYTREEVKKMRKECKSQADWEALAEKLNYNKGWAAHQMKFIQQYRRTFA